MKQEGLIDCVIEDVRTVNGRAPPAEVKALVKDTGGEVAHGDFCYSSVIGMLLYKTQHS